MTTKICNKCNETKSLESFYKEKRCNDGYSRICKPCKDIQNKIWLSSNKERRRISTKKADKVYSQTLMGKFVLYKKNAKKGNIEFNLTKDEFKIFWNKPCFYCNKNITTIGIDRVDSKLGYNMTNCVSCCTICNYMKLDHSEEEWYGFMVAVLKHKNII